MAAQLHSRRQIVAIAILLLALTGTVLWVVNTNLQNGHGIEHEALLQPHLSLVQPASNTELAQDGRIEFLFDQPMDRASVEQSITLDPPVPYQTEWTDDLTLRVILDPVALSPAMHITVKLADTARSQEGYNLDQPVRINLQTAGFLRLTDFAPGDDEKRVASDSTIRVVFNRPVVSLTPSSGAGSLPNPLRFVPDIPGSGEWINTSIFTWHPQGRLLSGQKYSVSVDPDLADRAGAPIDRPYTWTFTTRQPTVLAIEPRTRGDRYYSYDDSPPDTPITVTFDEPMDHASSEAGLIVSNKADQKSVIAGAFSWNEDSTVMTLKPDALLDFGTTYAIKMDKTARSADGNSPLDTAHSAMFDTLDLPEVEGMYPDPVDQYYRSTAEFQTTVQFNTAMDEDTLLEPGRVTITPEPLTPITLDAYTYSRSSLTVSTRLKSGVEYTLTVNPGAVDIYGNRVDQPYTRTFTMPKPRASLQINGREFYTIYDASQPTRIILATRNVQQVDFTLFRMPDQDIIHAIRDRDFHPTNKDIVREWTKYPQGPDDEPIIESVPVAPDGGALAPGMYMLRVNSAASKYTNYHYLFVVNANLTYKYGFKDSLVWLTDLHTAQPIAGKTVILYPHASDSSGSNKPTPQLIEGVTGSDGTVSLAAGSQSGRDPYSDYYYYYGSNDFAMVNDGSTFAIALSSWQDGISPGDFGLRAATNATDQTVYLYTDRPIYRPGQVVYFRGIVRDRQDMLFSVPEERTVTVNLRGSSYDNSSVEEQSVSLAVSDIGTFDGSFTLPESGGLGEYSLVVDTGSPRIENQTYDYWWGNQRADVSILVADYRKPEFDVKLTAETDQVMDGDTGKVTINADFYSGGPVSSATVKWIVKAYPDRWVFNGPGRYRFADYEAYWGYLYFEGDSDGSDPYDIYNTIAEGEGVTDKNGKLKITFPAYIHNGLSSQKFTIEAEVQDVSGTPVNGRIDVMVHKTEYYVGIASDRYWGDAGQPQTYRLLVVDWAGKPVAGQSVSVQLSHDTWERVRRYNDSGEPYWDWTTISDPAGSPVTAVTDDKGEATAEIVPPSHGSYRVRATVTDTHGQSQSSSAFLWASSYGSPLLRGSQTDDQIDLIPDQASYKPGQTAVLLIASPFESPVNALITIEREGILRHQVISLPGGAYRYELPITSDLAPNIYVSATLLKSIDADTSVPDFRMGLTELKVEPVTQTLNVRVIPKEDIVLPGKTTRFDVVVTDQSGAPVKAEVSLALVDLAVLRLRSPNSIPIVNHFYRTRLLGVRTAQPLTALVARMFPELIPDPAEAGGRGGGGPGLKQPSVELRDEFKDTAYWNATVRTGDDGMATVDVPLPENVTIWRMDARAVTVDTHVGQAEVDIQATLPLLIRPQTPRFFVAGDSAVLSAVVNNNTDQDIDATVTLTSQGVALQGPMSQAVTIPAHDRRSVDWPVTALDDAQWADLIFSVDGGGYADATKPEIGDEAQDRMLPILRYTVFEPVSTAGQIAVTGSRTERVAIPPELAENDGALHLEIQQSLAASTLSGLDWLEHFAYECNEQFASRLLPNSVTLAALRDLEVNDPVLEKRLSEQVNVGASTLLQRQQGDGGWGIWPEDSSNVLTTTYVLHALIEAYDAGAVIDADQYDRAVSYLRTHIDGTTAKSRYGLNMNAYAAYMLARIGETHIAQTTKPEFDQDAVISGSKTTIRTMTAEKDLKERIDNLYTTRDKLSYSARALLAQAMWYRDPADPRLNTIRSELTGAAIVSATTAHWEESTQDYWNWGTDIRTTAIILDTYSLIWPDSELGPNITRWLVGMRSGSHWMTTQQTAWSLLALTDWMRVTKEHKSNYPWSVSLGGEEIASGKADSTSALKSAQVEIDLLDLLKTNAYTIERGDGLGRLYYTSQLVTYPAVDSATALNRGIEISRRYLDKDGHPVTQGHVGDVLTVEVTVVASRNLHYVVIDDPYPAGAEPLDPHLLTQPLAAREAALKAVDPVGWRWGWSYFSHVELRDERAVVSAEFVSPGTYQLRYQVRLNVPGVFHVIPPTAWQFYFPDIYGRGDGMVFQILPAE